MFAITFTGEINWLLIDFLNNYHPTDFEWVQQPTRAM